MLSTGFVASAEARERAELVVADQRRGFPGDVVDALLAAGWVPADEYRDHLGDQRVEHAVALGAALNERDAALGVIAEVREALAPGRPLYAALGAARAALEKVSG